MRRGILISTAAVALGSLLPWVSIFGITAYGIQGDGILTMGAALIGFVMVALWRHPVRIRLFRVLNALLAGSALLVAGYHFGSFAAIGVYVTFFAALAWIVISIVPATSMRKQAIV